MEQQDNTAKQPARERLDELERLETYDQDMHEYLSEDIDSCACKLTMQDVYRLL